MDFAAGDDDLRLVEGDSRRGGGSGRSEGAGMNAGGFRLVGVASRGRAADIEGLASALAEEGQREALLPLHEAETVARRANEDEGDVHVP